MEFKVTNSVLGRVITETTKVHGMCPILPMMFANTVVFLFCFIRNIQHIVNKYETEYAEMVKCKKMDHLFQTYCFDYDVLTLFLVETLRTTIQSSDSPAMSVPDLSVVQNQWITALQC